MTKMLAMALLLHGGLLGGVGGEAGGVVCVIPWVYYKHYYNAP